MKLRTQLLLLSLIFLGIPWTGCQFLRSNEQALLGVQQQGLEATGRAIANGVNQRLDLLYTHRQRLNDSLDDNSLHAVNSDTAPILDGFFDEWPPLKSRHFGTTRRGFTVTVTAVDDTLFLALAITDRSKRYNHSVNMEKPSGDRMVLTTWQDNRREPIVIATSAPGSVRAQSMNPRQPSDPARRIRGVWADVSDGYQIELAIPSAVDIEYLGVHYVDEDEGGMNTWGNIDPLAASAPPHLIRTPKELIALLNNFSSSATKVSVYDRWGWLLGASDWSNPEPATGSHGLTRWLYRQVLQPPAADKPAQQTPSGRNVSAVMSSALQGVGSHSVFEAKGSLWSRYAAPLRIDAAVMGVVMVEQPREQYLSFTDPVFEGLLVKGGLTSLFIAAGLFAFASLLSLRIIRLQKRLESAAHHDRGRDQSLPVSPCNDELDQLAQQFNSLLADTHRLENYLRALPRALAHEIHTPVAVIGSTLEHLNNQLTAADHTVLIARAQTGLRRLTDLLNAMNEASRLENSLGVEPQQSTDLFDLLSELASAYGMTYPGWAFTLDATREQAIASVAPDLIVQALDKLIANAVSFAHPDSVITVKLRRRGLWWRITVINQGPALPEIPEQLFSPMLSDRTGQYGADAHLGLGLYVVALVAKHHEGEPWARSIDAPSGAEIGFTVKA